MAKNKLIDFVFPFLAPIIKFKSLSMVFLVVAILAIIIVPLPSAILDFCLALSICISVLMILISMYIAKPTDLTTFPTLILLITLFRLSLNIATTRMILSKGHEGPSAVSDIIASFGEFVVGGNFVIGVVVFCILVLINFMVVTKGSTRVSEVQARFTLDAMPGKQMAIDADLNAGLITEEQARIRRQEIIGEANFYGAMDGSSKFIKGDAVAGIIITIVNIIGGLLIGMFQHDLDVSTAANHYTILTIGDGLVSQIPGLITSTATAIIITRASKEEKNFAEGALEQLLGDYKTLLIVGFIIFIFALVPGLPHLSLGFMALVFLIIGYLMMNVDKERQDSKLKNQKQSMQSGSNVATPDGTTSPQRPQKSEEQIAKEEEEKINNILKQEILELELGYSLIKIAESDLVERIRSMRKSIASTLGFLMPKIRLCDNLSSDQNEYNFKLHGVSIAKDKVYPDKFLAIDNGFDETDEIEGIEVIEPAFGSKAVWIEQSQKNQATISGYVVVHPAAVISTHMSELIKQYASELLTMQEVNNLLNRVKQEQSILVEECLKVANIGLIQKVLKELLSEQIPIKDMISILETITELASFTKDVELITDHTRAALNRTITNMYIDENSVFKFYTFDIALNKRLLELLINKNNKTTLAINLEQTNALYNAIKEKLDEHLTTKTHAFVLVVEPSLRRQIKQICLKFGLKKVVVLAFSELATNVEFEGLGSISAQI